MIITQNGTTICSSNNMTMVPRIGETIRIDAHWFKIKDVVWHIDGIYPTYVEIKI